MHVVLKVYGTHTEHQTANIELNVGSETNKGTFTQPPNQFGRIIHRNIYSLFNPIADHMLLKLMPVWLQSEFFSCLILLFNSCLEEICIGNN